ncbi:hypothetical protein CSV79_08455 [Sporosarcina sp. P13]|uniref:Rpn family recombination-promoting nuclease/putative transposase n=1 Tax=Sporosarcina sp. P13 TaxID=2048263 RepID=UPI000C1728A0|nr:Rpn family recombination-promoting nuclease/putative transposase [Sporosarcina sp. P13]PIC64079.1 hypothetical protein CSV79_08455 [Sporosarcina sp. P13]
MDSNSRVLKRLPLARLMDLKVDYAFKQLFGIERNKRITVVFLNAILKRTGRNRIKDISFTTTEAGGEHEEDKQSRLDLLVVTDAGEWINVEMQFTNKYDMVNRSIYYWADVYRKPMKHRMGYKELNPVIAINILNFGLFDQTEKFHTTYHLYEDEERFKLTNIMEFHFIEMDKLIRDWKEEKLNPWDDVLAKWLLLLGTVDKRKGKVYDDIFKELEEIAMNDETLRSAFESWEALSGTPAEVFAYESRLKRVLDEEAAVREAELRMKEAELRVQEADLKAQEADLKAQEADLKAQEADLKAQEADLKAQEADLKVQEADLKVQEADSKVQEATCEVQEEKRMAQEERIKTVRNFLAMGVEVEKIAEAMELDQQVILAIQADMDHA